MISELREQLDKMTDIYVEHAFSLALDTVRDAADDDGKIDLAELSADLMKAEGRFLDDMADVHSYGHRDIEEAFDAIESELAEYEEMPDHTEFLHELAADVTELSKYGNDTQKAQYLEYLDNCEELKEFGSSQSTLNTSANLELVI